MSISPEETIANALPLAIADLKLLASNKYCDIFEGTYAGKRAVFKAYKSGDEKLVRLEAEGIDSYHDLARNFGDLIDCRVLALNKEQRVIAIQFVPGRRLSDVLRELATDKARWPEGCILMGKLGLFLARLHRASMRPKAEPDPFHGEYIRYCSRRLREIPILGSLFFRDAEEEAEKLWAEYLASKPGASRAHGDFVLRNIHVENRRVGIIDFANTLRESHWLNDYFNLYMGLQNMLLGTTFTELLWASFSSGLGDLKNSDEERQFFYEYHRRRTLMLNLCSRNPFRWAKALLGMRGWLAPMYRLPRAEKP